MPLTDNAIRAAKPREKNWKLSDEKGLYLLITPNGSKRWNLKFRFAGKEKKLFLTVKNWKLFLLDKKKEIYSLARKGSFSCQTRKKHYSR